MKKSILLFCFLLSFTLITVGQTVLLNENFDYGSTANSNITLVTQNWARHSGAQGPQYVYPGLSYTSYPSTNVGGALSFTNGSSGNNDGDVNRQTSTFISSTSVVYASFLLNLTSAKVYNNAGDYFFHLGPAILSTTFRGRVYVMSNGNGFSFGLSKSSGPEVPVYSNTVLNFNQTYLVVLKYSFNASATTDDEVTLYVYSSGVPTSEPGNPDVTIGPTGTGSSADPTDIGTVAIRQGSNTPTGTIDGIRAADSWTALLGATGVDDNYSTVPTSFELMQNYPNPFNPTTTIVYSIPREGNVTLKIYNMLGQEVKTLVNEVKSIGFYRVSFDASSFSSGVYFYSLRTNGFFQTKKMILIK